MNGYGQIILFPGLDYGNLNNQKCGFVLAPAGTILSKEWIGGAQFKENGQVEKGGNFLEAKIAGSIANFLQHIYVIFLAHVTY